MTKRIFAFFVLFVMCLLIPQQVSAMGDLTITPWRIVFGPRDRSASVQLLNTSDAPKTYRMGWMILKATKDGRYIPVPYDKDKNKENDPHGVQNMVIFSPRQVTIEPNGLQVIRLSLRRPADLPPGEYHAHMSMTRLAKTEMPVQDPTPKRWICS
jgi:P pilus assembly chaperone PapD